MSVIRNNSSQSIYKTSLNSFRGKTLAVDISIWAHKKFQELLPGYIRESPETDELTFEVNWSALKQRWLGSMLEIFFSLIKKEIIVIVILDGKALPIKKNEHEKREEKRQRREELFQIAQENYFNSCGEFNKDDNTLEKYQSAFKNQVRFNFEFLETFISLIKELKLPILQCIEEADILIAALFREGKISGALSTDTDLLIYGVTPLIISFKQKEFELVDRDKFMEDTELTNQMLLDIAVLLGTDYNDKVPNIGAVKALKFITEYGKLELLPSKYYQIASKRTLVRKRFTEIPDSESLIIGSNRLTFSREEFFETGEEILISYRLEKKWLDLF